MLHTLCTSENIAAVPLQSAMRALTWVLTFIRLSWSIKNDVLSATVLELTAINTSLVALIPIIRTKDRLNVIASSPCSPFPALQYCTTANSESTRFMNILICCMKPSNIKGATLPTYAILAQVKLCTGMDQSSLSAWTINWWQKQLSKSLSQLCQRSYLFVDQWWLSFGGDLSWSSIQVSSEIK